MNEHYYAVIMAGGGGTRLWPLSRRKTPKQMLRIVSEDSFFQMAIKRLDGVFSNDKIIIVTSQEQFSSLHEQYPDIPIENYILEPLPRGTASVVGLAAVVLKKKDPDAVMAVLTADHIIPNVNLFQNILRQAYNIANDRYLVTLGIDPTYPSTGYGYIKCGSAIDSYPEFDVFRVDQFVEKPDLESAKNMLSNGRYDWNSGMFIWRIDQILSEFERQMPIMAEKLDKIYLSMDTSAQQSVMEDVWPTIVPETIDYGIMENAENVAVIEAKNLGWNDVGSWDSLFDVLESDNDENVIMQSNHIQINTRSSLIHSSNKNKIIATIDIDNTIIIDTDDALLISSRNGAQKVKQVVEILKKNKKDDYL